MTVERIYVFKRFERFWHWAQAALISFMALTGFEIHGSFSIFGFEQAIDLHVWAAWLLIGLWAFAIFWHVTTGEWRHYIPTSDKMLEVVRYYSVGIFTNSPHPYKPTQFSKHNPMQRVAYLLFKLVMAPAIWISGLLYLYYSAWAGWGLDWMQLEWVALVHTGAAFLLVIFFVGHVYLTTTGPTILAQVKAMITGWDEVED